jgi:putative ABC transport system permease protein
VLIIGGLIISQQMRFLLSSNLGLDTKQAVVIQNAGFLSQLDRSALKNELAKLPGIRAVTSANGGLPNGFNTSRVSIKGSSQEQQLNFFDVAFNYLDVMNIGIKEGRGFSENFLGDTLNNGLPGGPLEQTIGSVVLNETAIKELAVPPPVIGKQILWGRDKDTAYYLSIVGVAKDFHFTSLRNQIKPFGFMVSPRADGSLTVKLTGQNIQGTLVLHRAAVCLHIFGRAVCQTL